MAVNKSLRIAAEPMRFLGYASISSSFVALGGPLANPAKMHSLINMTDQNLVWSFDGVNAHGFLGANGGCFMFDIATNKSESQDNLCEGQGLQIYIATDSNSGGTSPSVYGVYMTVLYTAISN
jgi:hypothetical protein